MPAKTYDYTDLIKDEKKSLRKYKHEHTEFIDSITLEDFLDLEEWMKYFGNGGRPTKENAMLAEADIKNYNENLQKIMWLRFTDRFQFRKFYQMIRYRYTDLQEHIVELNWNEDTKWRNLANGIIARSSKHTVYQEWIDNRLLVIEFLKQLYQEQDGKCAISNLPMNFDRKNESSVSVDRIDSTIGYQPDNIHLTCWWVNRMKFDWDLEDFRSKVKLLSDSFVNG
jgi:hypothetical protein